eukprot:7016523-Heterocapsa_arctica.AAC.1
MVIARMPEDRSNILQHRQQPSHTLKAIYTCMCTPVGPTDNTIRHNGFAGAGGTKPTEVAH